MTTCKTNVRGQDDSFPDCGLSGFQVIGFREARLSGCDPFSPRPRFRKCAFVRFRKCAFRHCGIFRDRSCTMPLPAIAAESLKYALESP
jgi:hypothetical protein